MSVACLLIGLVVASSSAVFDALPDADVLSQAETAFQEGTGRRERPGEARQAFARAATAYEELRRRGVDSAGLFRDEGNAYLLAGDLPHAILAYRCGLRHHPSDGLLRRHLELARARVEYPPRGGLGRPLVETWPPWLPHPSFGMLVGVALTLYALACLALARWWMVRSGHFLTAACLAVAAAAFLGVICLMWQNGRRQEVLHPIVLVADDGVLLRRGNGLSYPPRYDTPINRGVEARLLFRRDDWLKIELAGGESGWVPRKLVLVDE